MVVVVDIYFGDSGERDVGGDVVCIYILDRNSFQMYYRPFNKYLKF